jgi:hypothetical protein
VPSGNRTEYIRTEQAKVKADEVDNDATEHADSKDDKVDNDVASKCDFHASAS